MTAPPRAWFHGISYRLFEIYRQALRDLGCTLFEIEIARFWPLDLGHIADLLDEIRAFAPELAIGIPNGSTALHCRLPAERDGFRPHLFTDVLDLPTICIWDHAPLELADQLLTPLPDHPAQSHGGAHAALRRTLTHPRLMHCTRDGGQIRIMRELGLVAGDAVVRLPAQALPGFAPPEEPVTADGEPPVCFVGHIYKEPPAALPELEALAKSIITQWSAAPEQALWEVANGSIAALGNEERRRLALDADQTFFWRFMHRLIDHRAQTHRRLALLGASGTRIGFYGNLSSNAPNVPPNLVSLSESEIAFGPELASVFARHKITIDVQSPGFIDGYSFKVVNVFASGGFALIDRKRHFVDAFGEAGAAVSYSDSDDLAGKIEHFLSHPRQRAELAAELRAQIADGHTLAHFFQSLLQAAHDHFAGARPSRPRANAGFETTSGHSTDLLPFLGTHPHWVGARVEHDETSALVITPPQAWSLAAEMPIPAGSEHIRRRSVRLTLRVDVGRIGVALSTADGLHAEQLVSATRTPVSMQLELPAEPAVVLILRNTVDATTRATILQATLWDDVSEADAAPAASSELLPLLATQTHWPGARVDHRAAGAVVTTPAQAWAYAAEIALPRAEPEAGRRAVVLTLRVDAGRVGVALLARDGGALRDERIIDATRKVATLTFDLAEEGEFALLLRNATEDASRVTVLQATLCEWRR